MAPRRILFITGTRADYGKLKPLMKAVEASDDFEAVVFITGMHTLTRYGYTADEVRNDAFSNIYVYSNQIIGEPMDLILANTVTGLARYVHDTPPDLIVVHGDRAEALAGAIVGSIRNIPVAHIEGGEVSGTIDELLRHAVSKLTRIHFVANDEAARRLLQMGEAPGTVHVIGSPDIDVMLSPELPALKAVRERYEIDFPRYAISLLHPVTTEEEDTPRQVREYVEALRAGDRNYVVVYPNNDPGTQQIMEALEPLRNDARFRLLPSLRFEYFLTLLRHADFIIGNSSAGIREAPVYGVPTIDVGTRQQGRFSAPSILTARFDRHAIVQAIARASAMGPQPASHAFGRGDSCERFMRTIRSEGFWALAKQKTFVDLPALTAVA